MILLGHHTLKRLSTEAITRSAASDTANRAAPKHSNQRNN